MDISNTVERNFDFFYEELITALNDQPTPKNNQTELRLVANNDFKVAYDSAGNRISIYRENEYENVEREVQLQLDAFAEMGSTEATMWVGEAMLQLVPELREKLLAKAS